MERDLNELRKKNEVIREENARRAEEASIRKAQEAADKRRR